MEKLDVEGSFNERIRLDLLKDPLTHLLLRKLSLKSVFLLLMLPLSAICVSSLYYGSFFNIQIEQSTDVFLTPLIEDYGLPFIFLMVFISYFIFKNLFNNVSDCFTRLWKRKVFNEKEVPFDKYLSFFVQYEYEANGKKGYIIGLNLVLISLLSTIFTIIQPSRINSGVNIHYLYSRDYFPLTWSVMLITQNFAAFVLGVLLWKMYIIVKCMREVCNQKNFTMRLQPLNPDKCAGLQPLGKLSLNLSIILLTGSLAPISLFSIFFSNPEKYPYYIYFGLETLIFFVVLSSFLFFYPLLTAHNIMGKQKTKLLDNLSANLGVKYFNLYKQLANNDNKEEKAQIEELLELRELYYEAGKMPVWPFDTETLLKFVGTVIMPIFIILLQVLFYGYISIELSYNLK